MEQNSKGEEYHDPDYFINRPSTSKVENQLSDEEKFEKVRNIIKREFTNELKYKEEEVVMIDQRLSTARAMLHKLRYTVVNQYYHNKKHSLTEREIQDEISMQTDPKAKAEVSAILRNEQKRLHPSVRKLLGKKEVDIESLLHLKTTTRNKPRKDYSAMLKNFTIAEENVTSLRPDNNKRQSTCQETSDVKCIKQPRSIEPNLCKDVVTLNESTRNREKQRYTIIIGNTSKYAPPASVQDRSTHKWLLYVRGDRSNSDISHIVRGVTVTLHDTYAPHNVVHIDKPPFHLSRRGWGEFTAKVELHFAVPERNRSSTVHHTLKLDRQYTGVQMLGSETVVEVWLFSTEDMLRYSKPDDQQRNHEQQTSVNHTTNETNEVDQSIVKSEPDSSKLWSDFENDFLNDTSEMNVDEMLIKPIKQEINRDVEEPFDSFAKPDPVEDMKKAVDETFDSFIKPEPVVNIKKESPKKRLMKYIDPSNGKIYYLELAENLSIDKVQGIVINSIEDGKKPKNGVNQTKIVKKSPKKGISLLKPDIKNIKDEVGVDLKYQESFAHIENDHCYLAKPDLTNTVRDMSPAIKGDLSVESFGSLEFRSDLLDCLVSVVEKLTDMRLVVNLLLRKLPLVSILASEPQFRKKFPFVVCDAQKFWSYDVTKRRYLEWSRAKYINRLLHKHCKDTSSIWTTKQILAYSRYHGYNPTRDRTTKNNSTSDTDWSSLNDTESHRRRESSFRESYPLSDSVSTLSVFDFNRFKSENITEHINLCDDEDIDVCSIEPSERRVDARNNDSTAETRHTNVMTIEEERMSLYYIEAKCQEINIPLRNELIYKDISYSAVHKAMLTAMSMFAEELIRTAVSCNKMAAASKQNGACIYIDGDAPTNVTLSDVYEALRCNNRMRMLTNNWLAAETIDYNEKL